MTSNSFNLSTHKKDDLSMRLKQQNLRRAKEETRKLENEGKKMEERLMELKMAMNREKEERERQGGGFWKKGQQGNLTTYADEVLAKKQKSKSASSGKGKIKILRDKPLDLPERSNQPGTVAYIAQRGSQTPRDKPKGPKCGQCEERGASVDCRTGQCRVSRTRMTTLLVHGRIIEQSCVQCAEDYCAGCFAAFHLKGNLKKHRSMPITATPRQCFASPRPSPSQSSSSSSYDSHLGEGAVAPYMPSSARKKDRNSPEGASGSYEPNNLLSGSYDESEQAASFQEALQAWRAGKAAQGSVSEPSQRVESAPTPRGQAYSLVRTPTVNVDSSTGTIDQPQDIEIKFNTSSLSYAERLLLKKHRRTDVDTLFSPRSAPSSAQPTPRAVRSVTPRDSARGPSRSSIMVEEFDDADFDDEERVDFQSLLQASQTRQQQSTAKQDPDTVSIVEVESMTSANIEQTSTFKIQEVDGTESWSNETGTEKQTTEAKPPKSAKSRRRSAKKSARSSVDTTQGKPQVVPNDDVQPRAKSKKNKSDIDSESQNNYNNAEQNTITLGNSLNDIQKSVKEKESRKVINQRPTSNTSQRPSSGASRPSSGASRPSSGASRPTSGANSRIKVEPMFFIQATQEISPTSVSVLQRPVSVKSRPKSSARAQSRQGTQSRAGSSKGSRPASRANSRMGSSRASSRMERPPGLLTKGPSEGLQAVARMTPTSDREYKGIDSFFMVGVQPSEQEERVMTPSKNRKGKDEKIKVSYQLYNMAPKSWKPDFSMSDSVPVDNVDNDDAEDDRAQSVLAYHAYSEQVMSEITDKLISRFGELPLDDDRSSDQSSGSAYRSLGEEYRTFTPTSTSQNSPLISGRGTPVLGLRSARRESNTQSKPPSPKPSQKSMVKASQDVAENQPRSFKTPRTKSARQPKFETSLDDDIQVKKSRATPRAKTPRTQSSRAEVMTPRRSKTYHGEMERPVSRAIVMEGTDLSIFDEVGDKDMRNQDDEDTLDQLEWELASESGRLTADGKVSRMEMEEDLLDAFNSSIETLRSLSRLGQDQGYDINSKLRNDELDDDEVLTAKVSEDEDDVRALH